MDGEQAEIARSAWRNYGKAAMLAALNLWGLFCLCPGEVAGEPLLAKGTDFAATDIELVTWNDDGANR